MFFCLWSWFWTFRNQFMAAAHDIPDGYPDVCDARLCFDYCIWMYLEGKRGKQDETGVFDCIWLYLYVCDFVKWMRFDWICMHLIAFVGICLVLGIPNQGSENQHTFPIIPKFLRLFINFHCNAHRCWGCGLLHSVLATSKVECSSRSVTFPACQMHPNAFKCNNGGLMIRAGCSDKDLELFWGVLNVADSFSMNFIEFQWIVIRSFDEFDDLWYFSFCFFIPWAQKLSWPVQPQERQWSADAPSLLLGHAAWQFVEGLGRGVHLQKSHPYLQ